METSKCISCKNLFVVTAEDENEDIFSRSSCLVDSQCFGLLWERASQVFTAKIGDASIPFITVCSHWVLRKPDTYTTWGVNHVEG
jgi:hypothetical protein